MLPIVNKTVEKYPLAMFCCGMTYTSQCFTDFRYRQTFYEGLQNSSYCWTYKPCLSFRGHMEIIR